MEFQHLELIEAYLEKRLGAEDVKAFEARLKTDPELTKEFGLYKDIGKGVQLHFDQKLKERLKEEDKRLDQQQRFRQPTIKMWYAAAAIILILLVPAWFFFSQPDYNQLYADNYAPYHDYITNPERSEAKDSLNELETIMLQYRNREYRNAIVAMDEYLSKNPERYELQLYRGIAYLESAEPDKAIADFKTVTEKNQEFARQARWYLALAYLKQKEKAKAVLVLEKISEESDFRKKEADDILDELK